MESIAVPAVRYTASDDGMSIAYLDEGEGRTVIFLPFHHNQLERRWVSGGFSGWLRPLAESHRLIAYDSRGQGLSSRDLDRDPSVADYRRDLEAVIAATGARTFVLIAYGGFGHVALEYATDHPSSVEALVLICTCESFSSWPVASMLALAEENWDLLLELESAKAPERFRDVWLSFLRASSSGADYARLVRAFSSSSVTELLPTLSVPVLILHSLDQHWLSVEEGSRFASRVPGARLKFMDGNAEPNEVEGIRAIKAFLDELSDTDGTTRTIPPGRRQHDLSSRETEVLRLLAAGSSNQQIADDLVISLNTVRRHVSNIFDKTGAANRAQATAYAKDHGLA